MLDDRLFNYFNGYRRRVDAEHAGSLTGCRADAPSELGKVVGRVKRANRVLPPIMEDQIVPIGNDVADRTTGMTEWHATIHATGALRTNTVLGKLTVDLKPIVDPFRDRPAVG